MAARSDLQHRRPKEGLTDCERQRRAAGQLSRGAWPHAKNSEKH